MSQALWISAGTKNTGLSPQSSELDGTAGPWKYLPLNQITTLSNSWTKLSQNIRIHTKLTRNNLNPLCGSRKSSELRLNGGEIEGRIMTCGDLEGARMTFNNIAVTPVIQSAITMTFNLVLFCGSNICGKTWVAMKARRWHFQKSHSHSGSMEPRVLSKPLRFNFSAIFSLEAIQTLLLYHIWVMMHFLIFWPSEWPWPC